MLGSGSGRLSKQFFSEAFKVQAFTEVWGSKVLNAFYTEFL